MSKLHVKGKGVMFLEILTGSDVLGRICMTARIPLASAPSMLSKFNMTPQPLPYKESFWCDDLWILLDLGKYMRFLWT